jgi:hypothetical protein
MPNQPRRKVTPSSPVPTNGPDLDAIYRDLNAQQLAVIRAHRGPVRCVAGVGSGKTKVLTHRLADMLGRTWRIGPPACRE